MSKLTEHIVLSRTRAQDLNSVRKLNCWGSDLTDVQIVRKMSFVEVLSLSVNKITTLADFAHCRNLQELYLRKNNIKDLNELVYLQGLPRLHSLWLADNPCSEGENYRLTVLRTLPNLEKLDNIFVQPDEIARAKIQGEILVDPSDTEVEGGNKSQVLSPLQVIKNPVSFFAKGEGENEEQEKECSSKNVVLQATSPVYPHKTSPMMSPQREESHLLIEKQNGTIRCAPAIPNEDDELLEMATGIPSESSASNTGNELSPQHQHAFHARVQTLVDHSGRRIRKTSDINCAKDSCTSPTDGKSQSGHGSPIGNEKQFSTDPDDSAASGDGYRIPLLEGTDCSFSNHEFASNNDQKSQISVQSTPRSEKNVTQYLAKGGRNRNSNILSAVLCLVKELDYASLEVVETAIHCRMEEMYD